jgi:chromosome segregation ATPase
MKPFVLRGVLVAAVVGSAVIAGSLVGRAQSAAPPPDILTALLGEVRGLRTAMEQMASAGPRVQLALGRLQLQEQRVNTTVRRLDTIRSAIANADRDLEQKRQQLKVFESASPDSADAKELEHMMAMFKSEVALLTTSLQRLQTDEASIFQELTNEQSRWSDFNRRLEELERALGDR